ncbi:MAG: transposase [Moorea sp. SIO4A3]|nr:transposase [Moorena sp. SIO4A3]
MYFELLDKKGNSNYDEQTQALEKVLGKFTKYKVVVLGDREFCSVDLATWLKQKDVYFCLRLKKNHFIEQET